MSQESEPFIYCIFCYYNQKWSKAFNTITICEYPLMSLLKSFGHYFSRILPWMAFKIFSFHCVNSLIYRLVCLPLTLIHLTMGDFLGFMRKNKWDLFIGTGIHIYSWALFFLKIVWFNESIAFKMSLSCSLKFLYLVS